MLSNLNEIQLAAQLRFKCEYIIVSHIPVATMFSTHNSDILRFFVSKLFKFNEKVSHEWKLA